MAVGGGALAWWTWREEPRPGAAMVETAAPVGSAARSEPVAQVESARSEDVAVPAVPDPEPAEPSLRSLSGLRDARSDAVEPVRRAPAREGAEAKAERELRKQIADELVVPGEAPPVGESSEVASSFAPPPPLAPGTTFRGSGPRAESEGVAQQQLQDAETPIWVGGKANITFRGGAEEQAGERDQEEVAELMRRRLQQLPRGVQEVPKPAAASEPEPAAFTGSLRAQSGVEPAIAETEGPVAPPSTGGTAEPNDAPFGDVFFRHYGVNPFLDPEEDRLSTFALDVDTGSWGVARRYLEGGHLPPPEAVRVEEIVNALDYGDPPPAEGDFALHAEGAPTPFGGGDRYRLLRFALKAREVDALDRKPAALTFVVDVSGSMAQENRLGLVKASLGLLIDELRPDDRVALVVYGSRGRVVLAPTADKEALRAAILGLHPDGSTNAEEGLALGYDLASAALRPGAINRVILASDGVANVGATGPDSILARARAEAARGVELTTLGFGMGNYNDVLMERLADDGDGRYAYLDTLEEARRVLVEELTGTLQTVAEEARAQVEFNPEVVERYRLLGYENRDVADERFRDDTVDAGEIGAGHTVTALYEVKLQEQATGRGGERAYRDAPVATLRLRWRPDGAEAFVETERALTLGELAASWNAASPALRLAGLAAEYAELLRGSYWAREGSLDEVFRGLQRLQPELTGDPRAAELAALAGKAARLAPKAARPGDESEP
jgi:Ca-activated chloride channel family protein